MTATGGRVLHWVWSSSGLRDSFVGFQGSAPQAWRQWQFWLCVFSLVSVSGDFFAVWSVAVSHCTLAPQ